MPKQNQYYTYIYLDPTKAGHYCYNNVCFLYEPIYVGKGKGMRYLRHLKNFSEKTRGHFKNKLLKLLKSEFTNISIQNYILIFRDSLLESEAFNLEKQLIKEIGRIDLKTGSLCNLTDGGEGMSGHVPLQETRQKLRKANLGKKLSEEHKKKLLAANLNKKLSEETKEKLRQANLGRKESEKTKQKIATALTGVKRGPCSKEHRKKLSQINLGKKLSEETKQKIGKASSGRKHSEETKQKMHKPKSEETKQRIAEARKNIVFSEEHKKNLSIAKTNKKHSEETKAKISQGNRGKKHSEETKEKIRRARLLYLERRKSIR